MPSITFRDAAGRRTTVLVPEDVAQDWADTVHAQGSRPVDTFGRRLRPYDEMNVAGHGPFAPAGIYVDHRDPAVERAAYELRDRLSTTAEVVGQSTLQPLVTTFGLRHWRDAYNTVRNVGRRHTGENGRDAAGNLRWRRWNNHYSRPATERADARPEFRSFGIEIEYVSSTTDDTRRGVTRDARNAGMTFVERWHSYGRDVRQAGWQGTYDSTVSSGGEIISDILVGDAASHDEVRDMLRIVRENGGRADRTQGLHVHHDTRDFSLADKVRLMDNLRNAQDALMAFIPAYRVTGPWSRALGDYEWDRERAAVAAGHGGSGSHGAAFNFGHLFSGSSRIEFRALGYTLNGRKVRAWIRVGQAFMAATKAGYNFGPATTVDSMLVALREHGGLNTWAADQYRAVCERHGRVPAIAA